MIRQCPWRLKILPIFTTLFVHLLSSCLYCKEGKTSYFSMTAQTVLSSQLSPRHLWFVQGPLSLADPFILRTHWIISVLHWLWPNTMQTEAFTGMWIKKFIFLGTQNNCLLMTDKDVCTCVSNCWVCSSRHIIRCAISYQLSWKARLKTQEPQQQTLYWFSIALNLAWNLQR